MSSLLERVDPRLQILWVAVVGVGAFVLERPPALLGLLGLHLGLWFAAGLGASALLRSLRRIGVFLALMVLSYAFMPGEGDRIVHIPLGLAELPVSLTGLVLGSLRSTRVVSVILAAQIVQLAGAPRALVTGMRRLGAPQFLAYGLDLVLDTLGPGAGRGGGRRRRGRGSGGGRESGDGLDYRRLLRGDLGGVGERLELAFADARQRAVGLGLDAAAARDLSVLVGLNVLAMGLRFLRVAPGFPVAPGHKGLLLIPLYIVAHSATRSRWGATQYGAILGVVSVLMGMGKFGPFEILRHVTPGLFVDLVAPLVRRVRRKPGVLAWGAVGAGAALTRISTLAAVALVVEVPPLFWAVLVPTVAAHLVFGALSGAITSRLLRWAAERGWLDLSPAGLSSGPAASAEDGQGRDPEAEVEGSP